MLCITHSETLSVLKTRIDELLLNFDTLYCRNKKEILHYFPLKALYDINIPPTTYIPPTTKAHDSMYYRHGGKDHVNTIIPVVKHYELCEQIYDELKSNINKQQTEYV